MSVGIIMGSSSDMPKMKAAIEILKYFEIPHKVNIVSAHRTPDVLYEYAKSASGKGIKVIIAGAGGAAHLPGMCASMTVLPVVGVPIATESSTLNGKDALYSIVQMPRGIPVATVAINNSTNAALLAAQILATSNAELMSKLHVYRSEQSERVKKCDKSLRE